MPDRGTRSRRRHVVGSAWFQLALAIVVTGLVLTFVAKPFWVPSGSMEATLEPGDRVLVNRLAYLGSAPATGDIIVFDAGPEWKIPSGATNPLKQLALWVSGMTGFGPTGDHTLIKRVIAGPGQTASCCSADGRVRVDGTAIDETYVTNDFPFQPGVLDCTTDPASERCFPEVTVPEDSYLVLGDNRPNSADSAFDCRLAPADGCWRWATRSEVVGKAVVILWPLTRWRAL